MVGYKMTKCCESKKTEGQYMTPYKIVSLILDSIGYMDHLPLNKFIMEPSFGDGVFLLEIIRRIIAEGLNANLSSHEISGIIRHFVFGIEKDPMLYQQAVDRLDHLVSAYGLEKIDWKDNLICGDALSEYKNFTGKFDYVAGNPPYIRIHNIQTSYRDIVKEFSFTDGMADMYVAFYEIGITMLNDNGKLGYISPNSFLKNTSQKKFRDHLIANKYISAIYDFKDSKLFKDADTYTCICILDKDRNRQDPSVLYKEYNMYKPVIENRYNYDSFHQQFMDKPWNLCSSEAEMFLKNNNDIPIKIKDIACVQNGIATNRNYIFVLKAFVDKDLLNPYYGKHTERKLTVYFKDYTGVVRPIESTILHRCVKGSRYDGVLDNTYIIFPYTPEPPKVSAEQIPANENTRLSDIGYKPLSELRLQLDYPNTYAYLLQFKDELSARDMDKNTKWFHFGRSQGLKSSCLRKVVFKYVISKDHPHIEPYVLDEDVVVYSGIFITPKKGLSYSILDTICNILKSDDFTKYCLLAGKDMSGRYTSVSARTIKEFGVSE